MNSTAPFSPSCQVVFVMLDISIKRRWWGSDRLVLTGTSWPEPPAATPHPPLPPAHCAQTGAAETWGIVSQSSPMQERKKRPASKPCTLLFPLRGRRKGLKLRKEGVVTEEDSAVCGISAAYRWDIRLDQQCAVTKLLANDRTQIHKIPLTRTHTTWHRLKCLAVH